MLRAFFTAMQNGYKMPSYWILKVWFSSNLCWIHLSKWIQITTMPGPLPYTESAEVQRTVWSARPWESSLVCAGRWGPVKGRSTHAPWSLLAPRRWRHHEDRQMGDKETSEFLQPLKTNAVPSLISKMICNLWKLKCPASKRYCGAQPAWYLLCWMLPAEIKLST